MNQYKLIIIITVISWSIFFIVVAILLLLLRRGGRSIETAEILTKISETRNQLGVMEMKHDSHARAMSGWLKTLLDRFGFLTAKHRARTDVKEDKHK